jgi:arylsulfatase A-like enzyme
VIASVDDNVGRVLDYLDRDGIAEDTIVIYTSDQGFFLGDHGWFDKRFMYEESLRMPFLFSYPRQVHSGSVSRSIINNVDFAPTLLELCGVGVPQEFQGHSFSPLLRGQTPPDWQDAVYYRYWMHRADHNVAAHYGIRTERYKLIYYYADPLDLEGLDGPIYAGERYPQGVPLNLEPEWELFDLENDPMEMCSVYSDPAYADIVVELTEKLHRLQNEVGDTRHPSDSG